MRNITKAPVLYIIIPCYNEEEALPQTAPQFLEELRRLIRGGKINDDIRIVFVDDGRKDKTWNIIEKLSLEDIYFKGIRLSRNCGHQNALLAGLIDTHEECDITISIDCDGQDDITAMEKMVDAYDEGNEIVYGVHSDRESDSFLKRITAEGYYHFLQHMGTEIIYNHADYRLMSTRVVEELLNYSEVNLYLRGLIPLIGFKSTIVTYRREKRQAGKSHYSISKMFSLAGNGIISLSTKPLYYVLWIGIFFLIIGMAGGITELILALTGVNVPLIASICCIACFFTGVQITCLGIIAQYIGRISSEVKRRPRFVIGERTAITSKKDRE